MLLALDVGNTQTVIGLFAADGGSQVAAQLSGGGAAPSLKADGHGISRGPGELPDLMNHWRLATVVERTADEYALLITDLLRLVGRDFSGSSAADGVDGIALCSSVPEVTSAMREMAAVWFDVPLVVIEP